MSGGAAARREDESITELLINGETDEDQPLHHERRMMYANV